MEHSTITHNKRSNKHQNQKMNEELDTNLLPPSSLTRFPNWMCFPAKRPRLARFITILLRGKHLSNDSLSLRLRPFSPTVFRTFFIISFPLNAIFLISLHWGKNTLVNCVRVFSINGIDFCGGGWGLNAPLLVIQDGNVYFLGRNYRIHSILKIQWDKTYLHLGWRRQTDT